MGKENLHVVLHKNQEFLKMDALTPTFSSTNQWQKVHFFHFFSVYTPYIWHGTHSKMIQIGSGFRDVLIFQTSMRISRELVRGHSGHSMVTLASWADMPSKNRSPWWSCRDPKRVILESNGYFTGFVYDFTGFNEVYVGFMGVDRLSGAETIMFGMFTQSIAMHKEWQGYVMFSDSHG